MFTPRLDRFFRLLRQHASADVFNPWSERDAANDGRLNGPAARRERLRAHLAIRPELILIGEASGYQGCHVSGIPFTSERLLLAGAIPRIRGGNQRLSRRDIAWSEPSATTVWGALTELGVADRAALWNAFPWHPHRPGALQSNRTPTRAERTQGLPVLEALLSALPCPHVLAVGRQAEWALAAVGCEAITLRHPSMGGARLFKEGLRRALRARAC